MDNNFTVAPSPINTIDDWIAKISLVYGAMHQFKNGDRDPELILTIIDRFEELVAEAEGVKGGTRKQHQEISRKLQFIHAGLMDELVRVRAGAL